MLKIAIIYHSSQLGGVTTQIWRWANWLAKNGHSVSLYFPDFAQLSCELNSRIRKITLGSDWENLLVSSNAAPELAEQDCIFGPGPDSAMLAYAVALRAQQFRRGKSPVFLTGIYHPYDYKLYGSLNAYWLKYFAKGWLKNQAVIFMSNQVKEQYQYNIGCDFDAGQIIPLSITAPQQRTIQKMGGNKFVITSVGRITPFKTYNWHIPIMAKELISRGWNLQWDIYGYGNGVDTLLQAIENNDVASSVAFKGALPYEKFQEVVSASFAFVGMGTALLEAGMLGVPAISAICDGKIAESYGLVNNLPYHSLGEDLGSSIKKKTIVDELDALFRTSDEDYENICKNCRDYCLEYSEDKQMPRLLELIHNRMLMGGELASSSKIFLTANWGYRKSWSRLKQIGRGKPS